MSGEYQIDDSGHSLTTEHNLFQLETINPVLEKFWLVYHKVQFQVLFYTYLHICLKNSKTYLFADDTNITVTSKSHKY